MSLLSALARAEKEPDRRWGIYSEEKPNDDDDVTLIEVEANSEKCGSPDSDSSITGAPRCKSEEDKSPGDFKSSDTQFRIPKISEDVRDQQVRSLGFSSSFPTNQTTGNPRALRSCRFNKLLSDQRRICSTSPQRSTHSSSDIAYRLGRQREYGTGGLVRRTSNTSSNKNVNRNRGSPEYSKLSEITDNNSEQSRNKRNCGNNSTSTSRWKHAQHPGSRKKFRDDSIAEVVILSRESDDGQEAKTPKSSVGTRTRSHRTDEVSKASDVTVDMLTDNISENGDADSCVVIPNGHSRDGEPCDEDILTTIDQSSVSEDPLQGKGNDDSGSGSDFDDIFSNKKLCTRCLKEHRPGECKKSNLRYPDCIPLAATPREPLHKDSSTISTDVFYSRKPTEVLKSYEKTIAQCMAKKMPVDTCIEWKAVSSNKDTKNTSNTTVKRKAPTRMANKRRKDDGFDPVYQPNQRRKAKSQKGAPENIPVHVITSSDEEEEENTEVSSTTVIPESPHEMAADPLPLSCDDKDLRETVSKSSTSEERPSSLIASRMKLKGGEAAKPIATKRTSPKKARRQNQDIGFERDNLRYDIMLGRTVRIGKVVCNPTLPLEVTSTGITLTVEIEGSEVQLSISEDEIESLQVSPTKEPRIIVLSVNQKCALRIKSRARIRGRAFNPGSIAQAERDIVLQVAEEIPNETQADIIDWVKERLAKTCTVIRPDEAQEILNRISVPEEQADSGVSSSTQPSRYPIRSKNGYRSSSSCDIPVKKLIVYPRPPIQGCITVTTRDTECLTPGVFLNDVVIDFYLKYIFHDKLDETDRLRTHIFSSYFYKRLTHRHRQRNSQDDVFMSTPDRMHKQVHKWTRNVDIFEKDFLIVPVNQSLHWFLAIICFPNRKVSGKVSMVGLEEEEGADGIDEEAETNTEKKDEKSDSDVESKEVKNRRAGEKAKPVIKARPIIIIFDSLGGSGRQQVFCNLRHYLSVEWRERREKQHGPREFTRDTIKGVYAKVPHQDNNCDCGVFLLQYVESFFEDPITNYHETPIKKQDWFPLSTITGKRQYILDLIHQLNRDHQQQDDAS